MISQTSDAQIVALTSLLHCDRWLRHSSRAVQEMLLAGDSLAASRLEAAAAQHAPYLAAAQACHDALSLALSESVDFVRVFDILSDALRS